MIIATVVLKSANGPDRDKHLGSLTITNDGTGSNSVGNYDVRYYSGGKSLRLVRKARLEGYPRNKKAAMHIVHESLKAIFPNG